MAVKHTLRTRYVNFRRKKNGKLREFDLNGEKVNYHYFQEVQHQTQQQISRGVKESHCDSFYNNNIRYLYFSDLIISASSSFFQSGLVAVLFLQHRYVQVYQSRI